MSSTAAWRRLSRREIHRRIKRRLERVLRCRWPGTRSAFRRAVQHLLRRRTRLELVRIARLSASAALFLILHTAAQLSAAHADTIDLSDIQTDADPRGFIIRGDTDSDNAGVSVSTAGDVNGDGLADLVIGAKHAQTNGSLSGTAYVVFGKPGGEGVELSEIPADADAGGFAIYGVGERHYTGYSVSGAGDVNGDGLDDVVIAASKADAGGSDRGAAYVVFGKKDGASLQLSDVEQSANSAGFAIYGIADNDRVGYSVSGAGDVNGDGLGDIIVGAKGPSPNGFGSGVSYVVFGKAGGASVNLSDVEMDGNDSGFAILGAEKNDAAYIVSGAGDVNADGLADVVIGARGHNFLAGKTYVVFGKTSGASVDLGEVEDDLDSRGFVVYGIDDGDNSGGAVAGAGDVNGDGLADIITGATDANFYGGESYVVFGKPDGAAVQLSDLVLDENNSGFLMSGATADQDESGTSVSGIGDANGDGFSDVIIGVRSAIARRPTSEAPISSTARRMAPRCRLYRSKPGRTTKT